MNHGRPKKLGALTALLLNGCLTTSCPDAGCYDTQALVLYLKAEPWVAGEYVVTIADPKRSFECRFGKGAGDAAIAERCDQVSGEPTQSRAELHDHEGVEINLDYAPQEVSVSVRRDGATLLDEKLTPSYNRHYPGDPECGVCVFGMEMLTLPDEEA